MLDPRRVPQVDGQEMTARFVISKSHVNWQTKSLKADAFVPHPYQELSVTRLIEITDDEIWDVGRQIALSRLPPRTLRGRGDVLAATYIAQRLLVVADPVDGNPNHANVKNWPSAEDQAGQLMIAKEIAAVARFVPQPADQAP